jgi:RNA polymerase sigma-70 factor (ECF subfamily)
MGDLPAAPNGVGAAAGSDVEQEAQVALARGDRNRALTLLMSAYARPLYRYCRAMLRQPEMAEDAHQTVFFQAYQDLHRFGSRSSFKTWLFGIARHRCLDALKAHRRRTTRFASLDDEPERSGPGHDQEAHVAGREMADALRGCLDVLSSPVRDALLLRYQAGMSYVEMESVCGERAPTLQARVARALPSLRRCLEQQGVRP